MPVRRKAEAVPHHTSDRDVWRSISARDFLPKTETLPALQRAVRNCQGCPLYQFATQTVFGEGPTPAPMMLVGETPGDQEDRQGRPFVGPAGRLLDDALAEAGLSRDTVYITNAVKHFKWEERGKRRLHKKPSAREQAACRPWLEAEIHVVRPRVIVCLGATAGQSLLGPDFRITKERGKLLSTEWAHAVLATHHPSAALRAPRPEDRHRMRAELAADLKTAGAALNRRARSGN
jgi:uracil-DNA glycosylase